MPQNIIHNYRYFSIVLRQRNSATLLYTNRNWSIKQQFYHHVLVEKGRTITKQKNGATRMNKILSGERRAVENIWTQKGSNKIQR